MSDIAWIQLKNIVLIICTCASIYFISPWMCLMMLFYTIVNDSDGKVNERQI